MSDDPTVEPRAALADLVPLSPAQELIWAGQRLHGETPLYNMAFAFRLEGALDVERFRAAFDRLIASRDALRTVVEVVDGRPAQRILDAMTTARQCGPLALIDLRSIASSEAGAEELLNQRCRRPLALDRPMFDSLLVRLGGRRWIWYLCQHHLVTDAWSMMVLQRQLADDYGVLQHGAVGKLRERLEPAFLDYVRALDERPSDPEAESFWAGHRDLPAPRLFGLPPAAAATASDRRTLRLGVRRSAALRELASRPEGGALTVDLGLFNAMATLLFALLHRLSGQRRLAIGAPAHNRLTPAERETVGLLTEVFPLQVEVQAGDRFIDLLAKVRTASAAFLRHAVAGAGAATSHRSLAGVLNFIRGSFASWPGLEQQIRWLHPGHQDVEHPLRLHVHDLDGQAAAGGELGLQLDLNRRNLSGRRAAAAEESLLRLLDAFLADWRQPIGDVELLDDRQTRQQLQTCAGAPAIRRPSVIDSLLSRAAEQPQAVALQLGEAEVTYGQLIHRVRRLRLELAAPGVGSGQAPRIGIAMRRSPEAVVAMLAVMATGASWVALDPRWPPSRLAWMVADAAVDLILVSEPGVAKSLSGVREFLVEGTSTPISDLASVAAAESWPELDSRLPAYVLYTSGSTGRPKGAAVSHGALANYVAWAGDYYWSSARRRPSAADRPLAMAWFSPLTFDLTLSSIFLPLLAGGRVVIYPEPASGADLALLDVVRDDRVDLLKLTPSHLTLLEPVAGGERRLGQLIFGGEALTGEAVGRARAIFGHGVEIHNEYGPTEATVGCVVHSEPASQAEKHQAVPIGAPIAGLRALVLDRRLRLMPPGVVGELYLGGIGLAQGYLGRARLTAERFVADPWAEEPGARLYRTGDLTRLDESGQLHFLGRRDGQVKVRGARVELGEIEVALGRHPRIDACAVELARRPAPDPTAEYCARCALPSSYPGTELDHGGVCNHCRDFDHYRHKVEGYFGERRQLRAILDRGRRLPQRPEFDCLALLSGGKDSTYMICQLVDMGYRVLAFTLDNGFISEQAKANISRVVEALGIDHQYGTTSAMAEIFVDSLERHANVCQGCFKTIYTLGMQLAQQRRIPFLVTGLSRGQLFETRLTAELFTDLDLDPAGIDRAVLEARKAYHRADDAVSRLLDVEEFRGEQIFEDVEIVDFYRFTSVSLDEMLSYLEQRVPWVRPSDTGRSTNCLINDVGIYVHRRRQGFHNYALPYSWDVRLGHKDRHEALEELDDEIDPHRVHDILHQIGYPHDAAAEPGGARLVAYFTSSDGIGADSTEIDGAELRAFLGSQLPDFMLPARFVRLAALPLTANGKLDREALQAPSELRPELAESYLAPRSKVEEMLCQVWAETLGIDRVGVRDDFLDLGGDSILATQIAARCHRRGLKLTPAQLFESATIERLAPLCEQAPDLPTATVETVAGEQLPTAAQCWLTEASGSVPRRWNMLARLVADDGLSAAELIAGLQVVASRHDALRTSLVAVDVGRPQLWVAAPAEIEWSRQVLSIDLSAIGPSDRQRQVAQASGQVDFDLARPPLLVALRFVAGEQPVEFALVGHHLIVDAVSWSILTDDLATVIAQLRRGQAADLPAPASSLRRWSKRLAERAGQPETLAQIEFWQPRLELPWTRIEQIAESAGQLAGLVRVDQRLDRDATAVLFGKLPQKARVSVEEVLITAAALALREVAEQSRAVRLLVERHGRDALGSVLDASRTMGWLTSLFPLVLDLPTDLLPSSALRAIKDQLRQAPAQGAEYGLLRYQQPSAARRQKLAKLDECQMSFNYLGRVSTDAGVAGSVLRLVGPLKLLRPKTALCPTAIELVLVEIDGELELAWGFDGARIRPADQRRLVEAFGARLASLIDLAAVGEQPSAAISSSDFPLANLDPDKFEKLGAVLGQRPARKR